MKGPKSERLSAVAILAFSYFNLVLSASESLSTLYVAKCSLNLSLTIPSEIFTPMETGLRGIIELSPDKLKLGVYDSNRHLLTEGLVLQVISSPGSTAFSLPFTPIDKAKAKISLKEIVTPSLVLKTFSETVGCVRITTETEENRFSIKSFRVWSCDRTWYALECTDLQVWGFASAVRAVEWVGIGLALVKSVGIGWFLLRLLAKPTNAAKIFPFYYSVIWMVIQECVAAATLQHYFPISSVLIYAACIFALCLLVLPTLSYIFTDSQETLHSIAQHEDAVEGDFVNYFQCRKILISWILLGVFVFLDLRSFFYNPSSQMLLELITPLMISVEIYLFALQDISPSFLFVVVVPNTASHILPWIILEPVSRSGEVLILFASLVTLLSLVYLQMTKEPRLWLRCRLVDNDEYLHKPKTLLLDELLKEHRTTEEDVCGICLIPFQTAIQSLRESVETNTQTPSGIEKESTGAAPKPLKSHLTDTSDSVFQLTKCGHAFHRDCLLNWNEQSDSCPICRQLLLQ